MNMKYDTCRLYQKSVHNVSSKGLYHTAAMPSIVLALYEANALALANCTYQMLDQIYESSKIHTNKIKIILNEIVLE